MALPNSIILFFVCICFIGCSSSEELNRSYPGEDVIVISYSTKEPLEVRSSLYPYYFGENGSSKSKLELVLGTPDTVLFKDGLEVIRYNTEGVWYGFVNDELYFITLHLNDEFVDTTDKFSYQFNIDGFIVNDRLTASQLILQGINFDQQDYDSNGRVVLDFGIVSLGMYFDKNNKITSTVLLYTKK